MSPVVHPEGLSIAFNRAIVDHFGDAGRADAEEVTIAAMTVAASYIAGVVDPISRGVLVAKAQWTVSRAVAEIVKADAAKRGDCRGT